MREFDLFVPLKFNDGTPIGIRSFQSLHRKLLDQFEGLTFFPQPNQGYWKMGGVTFQDDIVIYRVLTEKRTKARRFFAKLKKWLMKEFQQEEILIVERTVSVIP